MTERGRFARWRLHPSQRNRRRVEECRTIAKRNRKGTKDTKPGEINVAVIMMAWQHLTTATCKRWVRGARWGSPMKQDLEVAEWLRPFEAEAHGSALCE